MNRQLVRLAERRHALSARAAVQRAELAHAAQRWRTPLSYADRGMSAYHFIARHKALAVGVTALLAVWKPRWVLRTVRSGWLFWRLALRVMRSFG